MVKEAPKKRQKMPKVQKRKNRGRIWRFLIVSVSFLLLLLMVFFTLNILYPLQVPKIEVSTTVIAKEGEILRQFADDNGVFRHWTTLEEVSPDYLNALIQYEDRYYYQHFGINPFSTIRALWQWVWHQRIISGSSTLTMQVARLLSPHDRTLKGKALQAFRALQLELHYSKTEILTLYINLAPMGGNIEGISAASQRYFSKKASELTLSESALLVALPQRPSIYRPDRNLDLARQARDKVLQRLYDFGEITEEAWQIASQDPVNYLPSETPFYAPLLAERLRREYPEKHLIHSTIDYELQRHLERFLLDSSKRFPANVSAAIVVVDNQTHEVVSYIGSVDLFDKSRAGFVDMVTAIRSPGSTLKPFAFGLALDYGIIHEASLLTDVPRSFDGYEPQNFDKRFRGRVPMYRALQQSLNIPVVQVFQHLTPYYFMKALRDAGIGLYLEAPTLSLILGGVGTTLEEQMKLFASLGAHGVVAPLRLVREDSLESETGFLQESAETYLLPENLLAEDQGKALLSPEASWIITKILRGVSPPKRLNTRKIAWKTGTSYGYRDGWAFGVSPDWTVGVWIGRPDAVPNIGVLAGDIAAPMLFDIFSFLPKDQTNFKKPYRVISETICWPSGRKKVQVPISECAQEFEIDTIAGKVPRTLYDAKGESPHDGWPKLLADDFLNQRGQEPINIDRQTYFNYISRRDRRDNVEHSSNAEEIHRRQDRSMMLRPAIHGVKIQTLANESIIFKTDYKIHLNAQGKPPFRWYLDGRLLSAPELDMNEVNAGIHRLSVLDEKGNSDQIQLEVRVID